MDYKQALNYHIMFEKELKPLALRKIAFHKRNIKISKQKIIDYMGFGVADEEQEAARQVHLKDCAHEIKFSQTGAKCWTYLHNKDYENAVKYYERFKPLCHERIENTDIDITEQDGQTYTNDNAYLKLCNYTKGELDMIEMFITVICKAKDVSVILEAGRKMNERKNRNNNKA